MQFATDTGFKAGTAVSTIQQQIIQLNDLLAIWDSHIMEQRQEQIYQVCLRVGMRTVSGQRRLVRWDMLTLTCTMVTLPTSMTLTPHMWRCRCFFDTKVTVILINNNSNYC